MITFGIVFGVWVSVYKNDLWKPRTFFSRFQIYGIGATSIALTCLNLILPKRRGLVYGMRTLTAKHFITVFKAIDCRIVLFILFNLLVINGATVLNLRLRIVFKDKTYSIGPVMVWLTVEGMASMFFLITTYFYLFIMLNDI